MINDHDSRNLCRLLKLSTMYIILNRVVRSQVCNGDQEDPSRSTITDSLGILLLRLRERTSERLPDDWHGTKYRAVKQLSKNIRSGKNSSARDRVTE